MIPLHDDNPTSITPFVTISFIAVCVLTYIWQFTHDPQGQQMVVYALGVIPAVLLGDAQLPADLIWVPTYATIFLIHVFAWRLDAFARKYALFVDFWK